MSRAKDVSAGLLVWRRNMDLEYLLGHPGGPYWARKDAGAWSLPKGVAKPGDDLLATAKREFTEETGFPAPTGPFMPLAPVRQKSGKVVHAFAVEADFDLSRFSPGEFEMEWPPRSGLRRRFPEIDRIAYFDPNSAQQKIIAYQRPFIIELTHFFRLRGTSGPL